MLVLLELKNIAILERPPHDVGLLAGALDVLGLGDSRPELVELLELDEVPDKRDGGLDNGTLDDLTDEAEGLALCGRHCWTKVWFI